MFNLVLNTCLYLEMQSHNIEIVKLASAAFLAESDVSKDAPKHYCNFSRLRVIAWRFCKGLRKTVFSIILLSLTSHAVTSVVVVVISSFFDYNRTSQELLGINCWVNKGVSCQNLLPSFIDSLPSLIHSKFASQKVM